MTEPQVMTEPTPGEILRALQRIEVSVAKVTDDHEVRLRKVERWVYAVPPTLILAAASVFAAMFGRPG